MYAYNEFGLSADELACGVEYVAEMFPLFRSIAVVVPFVFVVYAMVSTGFTVTDIGINPSGTTDTIREPISIRRRA